MHNAPVINIILLLYKTSQNNIKIDIKDTEHDVDWIKTDSRQDPEADYCKSSCFIWSGKFLNQLREYQLFKRSATWG
jgi:hypothetical protein